MRDLLKASLKSGSGTAISMALTVVSSKIMAVITGPAGVGLYSMLQQILQTTANAGSVGGGVTSLTQGVACKKDEARNEYIRAVFWIFAAASLVTVAALLIFAPWVASVSLGDSNEASVGLVRWVALPLVLYVALYYLNGILNGFREIGRLAMVSVAGGAANAIVSYPVSILVNTGYPIAFVGMLTAQLSAQITVGLVKCYRKGYLRPIWSQGLRPRIEKASASSFFNMAGTLLITGIFSSIVLLAIRSLIVQNEGLANAGIFNVAWLICMMYPTLALNSIGTYFFPTLSQLFDKQKRIDLMRNVFRLTTLIITPLLVLMIVLKPLVIDLLYSNQFYASLDILRWTLIGVYLMTACWIISMPVLAYPDMRVYFWTQNLWWGGLFLFSFLGVAIIGSMEVIGIGFIILYVLLLPYYVHYSRSRHGITISKKLTTTWFFGLALVVAASATSWTEDKVNWPFTFIWLAATALFMWFSLKRNERDWFLRVVTRSKR
jgi:O-antigen/teichoic acid export membrane protein